MASLSRPIDPEMWIVVFFFAWLLIVFFLRADGNLNDHTGPAVEKHPVYGRDHQGRKAGELIPALSPHLGRGH